MIDDWLFKGGIELLCTSKCLKAPKEETLELWYGKMKGLTDDQFVTMIDNMDWAEYITIRNLLLSLPNYKGERSFREYIAKNNKIEE